MNNSRDEVNESSAAGQHHESLVKNSLIMMVDDESINMDVLQVHLQAEGYKNFLASSDSRNVIKLMRESAPDILLLDLMMPEVSGFDILKTLREDAELKHLPVVVLTSSDDSETKLRALSLGANDFLSKPVDASELALRLRNTLIAQAYQHKLTHFDALTGLPNRKFLINKLVELRDYKNTVEVKAAMLMINLDRFKSVNDSLGRGKGDLVLHAFSQRLQLMFGIDESTSNRSADFLRKCVGRLGGDKFLVLLPFLKDVQEVIDLTSLFLKKMEKPLSVEGEEIYLTCSIGISVMPEDGESEQELIPHAETAMIHAKQRRHNSYAFYSKSMDAKARELLGIENGLRSALDSNEFHLTYQPKLSVATDKIVGAEALVRWQHPEYGLVSPEHFIPLAEDSGLIVPIGDFVLNEACRQTRIWRDAYCADFKVAVNVSIRQLYEDSFIDSIKSAITNHSLPPDALKIELTENMIMENAEYNVSKLVELKDIGVHLSIDDFGTGYSSLGYLQIFPVDELKIDKSFISPIDGPLDKAPIARAVLSLAHDLGMTVVAEGVENSHQLAFIKAHHCEEYQGFLCSSPLLAHEFEKLFGDAKYFFNTGSDQAA